MASTLNDLLQPQVILDVISRIGKGQGRLGRWFGFHYGLDAASRGTLMGPASQEVPTRTGSWRIFDRTRTVAMGRAPGTGPATWRPQPIGEVAYSLARFHEKIPLEYEQLSQLSNVAGPSSVIDPGGQRYITLQEGYLAQRFNNAIEVMVAGMIRGHMYLKMTGENFIPLLTAPSQPFVDINYQVPAGNLGQLDMLGAGAIIDLTWANATAKIVSAHLPGIVDASVALTGMPITDAWTSPAVWGKMMLNTEVVNTAGSSARPFDEFEYVAETQDGRRVPEWVAVLRGYPLIRWHIMSDRLVLDGTDTTYAAGTGTLTPVLPANTVLFTPQPDPEWIDLLHCGEYVSTAPGMPAVKRPSYFLWSEYRTQPTVVELIGLLNCLPRLSIPKALALATVIF